MGEDESRLQLYLNPKEGPVPFTTFQQAIDAFRWLLPATGSEGSRVHWVLSDLRAGSALVEVAPIAENGLPTHIALDVLRGLQALEDDGDPPLGFDRPAIQAAKDLALLAEKEDLFASVRRGDTEVIITGRTAARASELLNRGWTELGSIEGALDMVSIHGRFEASIYPALQTRRVRCGFNPSLLEQVREALGRRVEAIGMVRFGHDGTPESVMVSELTVFRRDEELPSVSELVGVGATWFGPLPAEEYVRRLRDDD